MIAIDRGMDGWMGRGFFRGVVIAGIRDDSWMGRGRGPTKERKEIRTTLA